MKDPDRVGAVLPSSSFLAQEMIASLKNRPNTPICIVEVGAGVGEFTRLILDILRPGDRFDIIEIEKEFSGYLGTMINTYKSSLPDPASVELHTCSVLDWQPSRKYHYIVSGLPFNAFNAEFVYACTQKYKELLLAHGVITYFEYPMVPLVKRAYYALTFQKKKLAAFNAVRDVLEDFKNNFSYSSVTVYKNIPPARVCSLRLES